MKVLSWMYMLSLRCLVFFTRCFSTCSEASNDVPKPCVNICHTLSMQFCRRADSYIQEVLCYGDYGLNHMSERNHSDFLTT
jgi:hypothetical protein